MFLNYLTTDGLPKPDALQSVTHIILDSYTDNVLLFLAVILKVAHYRTGKLMPIRSSIINT